MRRRLIMGGLALAVLSPGAAAVAAGPGTSPALPPLPHDNVCVVIDQDPGGVLPPYVCVRF